MGLQRSTRIAQASVDLPQVIERPGVLHMRRPQGAQQDVVR
jgi:hypothetical protein